MFANALKSSCNLQRRAIVLATRRPWRVNNTNNGRSDHDYSHYSCRSMFSFSDFSTSAAPPPPTGATRPFRILGVQQIALGSTDKTGMSTLWQDIFGLEPHSTHRIERENVEEDIIKVGPSSSPFAVEIDLMQPIDPEKSPKVHIPPLNHFGLWVDNLDDAVDWMTKQGVRFAPGGIRKGAAGHNVAFIHPKGNDATPISGNGVLIELVQAPKEVIDAFNNANLK